MTPSEAMDAQADDLPATFAELPAEASARGCCRICGLPSTHRMAVRVRVPRKAGGSGTPPTVACHNQDYCEAHAVALFVKIKKAMR